MEQEATAALRAAFGRASAAQLGPAVVAVLAGLAVLSSTGGSTSWQAGGLQPQQIVGYARVLDGDTIEIGGTRIRLHGIDAAEGAQPCGTAGGGTWDCAGAATARLRTLMENRQATCDAVDRDAYGRVAAACRVGDSRVYQPHCQRQRAPRRALPADRARRDDPLAILPFADTSSGCTAP